MERCRLTLPAGKRQAVGLGPLQSWCWRGWRGGGCCRVRGETAPAVHVAGGVRGGMRGGGRWRPPRRLAAARRRLALRPVHAAGVGMQWEG